MKYIHLFMMIKKPPSSFLQWLSDHRQHIQSQHPNLKGRQINIIAGQIWQSLPNEQKQIYVTQYQTLMREYKSHNHHKKTLINHPQTHLINPKKYTYHINPYIAFAMTNRHLVDPTLPSTEIAKKLGQEWRILDESEKLKYQKSAKIFNLNMKNNNHI